MTRLISALLVALGLVLAPPAIAQQQTLNYQNADIRAVVQDVARVTGRTFIVDPGVQGTVTVVSNQPLSRTEMFEVFISTLRANGLVVAQTPSGAYRISPAEGASSLPGASGVVTEVFRLRTVDAVAAAEVLRPLVSAVGQVLPNPSGNTLTVADYADNLRRIRGILAQIDQDRSSVQTVSLTNTSAVEIADVLTRVMGLATVEQGGSAILSVTPVESSNSIVLRGDPEVISRALSLIADLDARAGSRAATSGSSTSSTPAPNSSCPCCNNWSARRRRFPRARTQPLPPRALRRPAWAAAMSPSPAIPAPTP